MEWPQMLQYFPDPKNVFANQTGRTRGYKESLSLSEVVGGLGDRFGDRFGDSQRWSVVEAQDEVSHKGKG